MGVTGIAILGSPIQMLADLMKRNVIIIARPDGKALTVVARYTEGLIGSRPRNHQPSGPNRRGSWLKQESGLTPSAPSSLQPMPRVSVLPTLCRAADAGSPSGGCGLRYGAVVVSSRSLGTFLPLCTMGAGYCYRPSRWPSCLP